MDSANLGLELGKRGFRLQDTIDRADGMQLLLINNVYMFETDAHDLADGRATLEEITARNKGQIFPGK